MSHCSPWGSWVGTVVGLSVLTDDKSRSLLGDGKLNDGLLVGHRLDGVGVAIFGKLDGAVVGIEIGLVRIEVNVGELIRGPQVWLSSFWIEDLGVELTGCAKTTN